MFFTLTDAELSDLVGKLCAGMIKLAHNANRPTEYDALLDVREITRDVLREIDRRKFNVAANTWNGDIAQ